MTDKPITIDGLFATVQLSDPLKTYKENIDTIQNLAELGTRAIKRRTDSILESIEQTEKWRKESEDKIAEETEKVKQHQKDLKERVKQYASLLEASKQDSVLGQVTITGVIAIHEAALSPSYLLHYILAHEDAHTRQWYSVLSIPIRGQKGRTHIFHNST